MAAFWNLGTITLTTDSSVVTGHGTNFSVSLLRKGDTVESDDGRRGTIDAVNGPETITLDKPWRGAGQNAAPYKAWYTPDDVTLEGLGRKALSALSSGNVTALANLEGNADLLAYFTGAGTMDVAQFNAYARALLAGTGRAGLVSNQYHPTTDPDQAALLATGGFGGGVVSRDNGFHGGFFLVNSGGELNLFLDGEDGVAVTRIKLDREGAIIPEGQRLALGNMGDVKAAIESKADAAATASAIASKADAAAVASALDGKQPNLGFTALEQGGGSFMAANKVRIGWDGPAGKLRAQVDSTLLDFLASGSHVNRATLGMRGIARSIDGFIIQWGRDSGEGDRFFAESFPNQCVSVVGSMYDAPVGSILSFHALTPQPNRFYALPRYYNFGSGGGPASQTYNWIAVGY